MRPGVLALAQRCEPYSNEVGGILANFFAARQANSCPQVPFGTTNEKCRAEQPHQPSHPALVELIHGCSGIFVVGSYYPQGVVLRIYKQGIAADPSTSFRESFGKYQTKVEGMVLGSLKYLKLLVPDAYDLILSKLEGDSEKDRDDTDYLFRSQKLETELLRQRYEEEL